jgi:hypothetical protein
VSETLEKHVIEYLRTVGEIECDRSDLAAAYSAAPPRKRRRLRPRGRLPALALAAVVVAASGTLATATGLIELNPNSRPPAQVVDETIPEGIRNTVGVLRRPAAARDRSAEARAAGRSVGSPWVVAERSIRALGATPLGESAYAMYVRVDPDRARWPVDMRPEGVYVAVQGRYGGVGADGPYALEDIKRGTALGTNGVAAERLRSAAPASRRSGRYITGVFPDGVAEVELTFRNGSSERHPVRDNVLLAHLGFRAHFPRSVKWLSAGGEAIRTVRF